MYFFFSLYLSLSHFFLWRDCDVNDDEKKTFYLVHIDPFQEIIKLYKTKKKHSRMASKEDKDVQMKEPKEGEEDPKAEERGDSFYVKLLDVDRKKTNGEGEIDEEIELTPEDMKRLTTEWVGKKINLRHDLKGGFGKITAAWHTKDGKTHVRLTPGTSKAGKTAAKMIKDGEITSVSAGWQVHKDKNSGRVVNKSADHVALTNLPVYEGTVIYAMASKDAGIQPDRDGVLRTKGGLAVLPVIENSNAAIRVDNMMVGASDGNEALERGSECLRKPTNSENAKGVTTNDDNDDEVTPPQNAIESLWTSLFENLASSSVSPFHRASGKENTKGKRRR